MHYLIEHKTSLSYPAAVREHHVELRLLPRSDRHQIVHEHSITTIPEAGLSGYTDYFGNRVDCFCVIAPHTELITHVTARIETTRANPFDFLQVPVENCREWYSAAFRETPPLYDYLLHRSNLVPPVMKIAALLPVALPRHEQGRPMMEILMELMEWVPSVLKYVSGATGVHHDLLEAVRQGSGVCQDHAHLFIAVARSWQLPCRYVMGYMDPGICGKDEAIATHAWAEVLVPGGGWIGFDPVHNLLANDRYVAVAVGRDSYDAAPQRGSFKGDDPGAGPEVQLTISCQ